MGKQTVKRRIFLSNALMVLVTLVIFLVINAIVIKVYSESIEQELKESMGNVVDDDDLEDMLEGFTVRRNEFILLFFADGILCIAALVIISQIFTKRLVNHIMEPLDALSDGARRIRNHDLTQDIAYSGIVNSKMSAIHLMVCERRSWQSRKRTRNMKKPGRIWLRGSLMTCEPL